MFLYLAKSRHSASRGSWVQKISNLSLPGLMFYVQKIFNLSLPGLMFFCFCLLHPNTKQYNTSADQALL